MYQDGERVYASATHETMEAIRSFHSEDGCIEIPMEARIRGNLLVVVHHIRAIPVAKKAGIVRTCISLLHIWVIHTCSFMYYISCICMYMCMCAYIEGEPS